ncbi:uncharacterized protein EHS24_006677 [Apiotrichum porosum]|uniref:Xylanolytic transcriptional activator regulatory domain-containing protein n=1 Tax=Apiotrichum porosum TaxID=105984 RepID=A0A427Y1R1_9TREE|nr:uncharacterized protein EHS24_006677 [Apiotrichum porosum]RSH85084.1 hypothetical protein EHS24_006677 [Apiotrichum porosum]
MRSLSAKKEKQAKCVPSDEVMGDTFKCTNCVHGKFACTFDIGYKKAGRRPRYSEGGPGPMRTSATQVAQSSSIPRPVMPTASRSAGPSSPPFLYQNAGTSGPADPGGQSADLISQESILNALADSGPRRASLQWETAPLELSPVEFSLQPTPTTVDQTLPAGSLAQDNAAGGLLPAGDITNSQLATSSTHIVFPDAPINRHSQVEDIAPWPVITFFLTLYLQYMHSLFPIVHKPSFHQIVTMRTDRSDRNARALICALVAYTIGQAPLNRMEGEYSREELARLQRRCHRGSLVLLDRAYDTVTLQHVGVVMANFFCSQSLGQDHRAQVYLSEACHLIHIIRLEHAQQQPEEIDFIEREMFRRMWWHVYALDITEAAAGSVIHMNDYEGMVPTPLVVDDEYITSQGAFEQPPSSISYMAGFNGCVQIFPMLARCLIRDRRLRLHLAAGNSLPEGDDLHADLAFVELVQRQLDEHVEQLPTELQPQSQQDDNGARNEVRQSVLGMQRANILVTETCVRLALLDFVTDLVVPRVSAERSELARKAYATLSSIPIEDLAANGHSIRGKIFRIVAALLRSSDMDDAWANTVHDWWSLFSRVNFVQFAPQTMLLHSAGASPEREGFGQKY